MNKNERRSGGTGIKESSRTRIATDRAFQEMILMVSLCRVLASIDVRQWQADVELSRAQPSESQIGYPLIEGAIKVE